MFAQSLRMAVYVVTNQYICVGKELRAKRDKFRNCIFLVHHIIYFCHKS